MKNINIYRFISRSFNNKIKSKNIQRFYPTNEIPYTLIKRKINFDKYGLYLIGELKNTNYINTKRLIILGFCLNFLLIWTAIATYPINFKMNALMIFICASGIIQLVKYKNNHIINKISQSMISKIYLSENLKDVVVQFVYPRSNVAFDIKSFYMISKENFENNLNPVAFPVGHSKTNEYQPMFVPYDLQIYDRELFCAIFRGYLIKNNEKVYSECYIEVKNKI
jgi:hypothetical protein